MTAGKGDAPAKAPFEMHESRVPASRFGRLWQYGGLATSMAFGAVGESFRRATGSSQGNAGSLMLSAGNMERLVAKLSRMRGAALKLGQMMSFQGMLRPSIALAIIRRSVQTPRCCQHPFTRSCNESKIVRTTCRHHNETESSRVISAATGGISSLRSTRNP